MARVIDDALKTALANQTGDKILRVLTWADADAYNAAPTVPEHTWFTTKYDIYSTSANVEIITANDYTVSDFTVFIIERGLKISGTEHTVQSGLFFVKKYKETYGKIILSGSSYPNQKISIAGDNSYTTVIEAFCSAIGKTAVFKRGTDAWLNYQFLPTGKTLSLNKAELFENLLKQKYAIMVYEESPNNLVFYNQDSYDSLVLTKVSWSPELSLFCATGTAAGLFVATSENGITWTKHNIALNKTWLGLVWSPELSLFCAVASNGVMTSPDGITWTARTAAEANAWSAVAWSPELSLFCAVATTGTNRVMTSPDGITWTARTAAEATAWLDVAWSPELSLFCAVADSGTNRVMTSPDGITWTGRTAAEANAWTSVIWSPELSLFCAVATTGTNRVMTSPDGTTWTARAAAEANQWREITWSPELSLFCAVANSGTNRVMTSPDGTTWTARTADANSWSAVTWSPELSLFCAVANSGTDHITTSPNGTTWTTRQSIADFNLSYTDGPTSFIDRQQSEVHFLWRDETASLHTSGDTTKPQWNLGFLKSTASAPTTRTDPYYKIFLQKAPVRLDITDGDKIHFTPYWSIDPTQTIDAMMQISEHLNTEKSPAWYQEIRSIVLFDKTEGGALPSTIERVAAYTPLVSTSFDNNLTPAINNLQALAEAVDDLNLATTEGIQDIVGAMFSSNTETGITVTYDDSDGTIDLDAQTAGDARYAPIAKGVTNGDSHNHVGGDGAALTYVQTLPMHGLNGTPAAGSTNYLPPYYYGVNATGYNFLTSIPGTVKNLSVVLNSAQPGTGSLVFTVQKNNVDTAIVITVAAGSAAGTYTNTANTVSVVATDKIIVKVVNNASGASAQIGGGSLQIEANTG